MNGIFTPKISSVKAFDILMDDIDEVRFERVISHSKNVGVLAGRIAEKAGVDAEYARSLGFLHDVGRKIDPKNHVIAGYRYLEDLGLKDYSFICLTHSFLNNDIDCIAGCTLSHDAEGYAFIRSFVEEHKNTVYDKIIQTCDLLCKDSGFTTLEDRLSDIESRKGTHPGSAYHKKNAEKQLSEISEMIGCPVYSLY